jgi:hypothetical protein
MSSSDFRHYGQRGSGRWITVCARNGHTFAVIAGLRLDTTGTAGHRAGKRVRAVQSDSKQGIHWGFSDIDRRPRFYLAESICSH